jgi:hypothetical protein
MTEAVTLRQSWWALLKGQLTTPDSDLLSGTLYYARRVKRLLILLIVLAGGLVWASLAVPTNAASVNGSTISQGALASDVNAVAHSPLYDCFLNGEQLIATQGQDSVPDVDGAGLQSTDGPYTAVNTAFVSTFLNTEIGHDIVFQLADQRHLTPTSSQLATARTELNDQVTSVLQELQENQVACPGATTATTGADVLSTMPTSFVNGLVKFDATISLLEEELSGVGSSTLDLQRFFYEHNQEFENACFSVATYTSEADAQAAIAKVNSGTPFATVASAAGGGSQGCYIRYSIGAELPAGNGIDTLAVNTPSQPIAEGTSFLVIEITKLTQTPFSVALAEVHSAVQSAGSVKARTVITAAEERAAVSVDPRYGTWIPKEVAVVPPVAPVALDVLNPSVNQATVTPTTATPATSSTGTSG